METGSQRLSTAPQELCTRFVPTFLSFTTVQGIGCEWRLVLPFDHLLESYPILLSVLNRYEVADPNSFDGVPWTRHLRVFCLVGYTSWPRYNHLLFILIPTRQVWPDYRTPKLSKGSMDW